MSAIAITLSLLGLVPFIVFAFGAVSHFPETAERMLIALIDYAGVFLAFGGGVHWGLALVPGAARPSLRFGAGILPLIVGWVGLVLAQLVAPSVALAVLTAGYLATVLTDHRVAQRLAAPAAIRLVTLDFFDRRGGDDGHGTDSQGSRPDHCILTISGLI